MNKRKKKVIEMSSLEQSIVESVRNGDSLLGKEGVLTPLLKQALESALEGELESHLSSDLSCSNNRRNGRLSKQISSESGNFTLETPRDRDSSFDPYIIKKRQTSLGASLENQIIKLFGAGMSYEDIRAHLEEVYDYEVSAGTISAVTDKLLPVIHEWRARPLERLYPIVFLDGMYFKARADGKVVTKVLYNVLGIDSSGRKDILGFYISESEGANFWLGVLNDLRERGVEDILIACVDGLKGFADAINSLFPQTEVQLCIVHQIRNSLRYVVNRDQKEFMADLKEVYQASSKDIAEHNLLKLDEKWGKKYPAVLNSWNNNWDNLSSYFKYSHEIRKMIYTTNAIEGFHRQVRKVTKTKGAFTSENALFKVVFCAINKITKKWTMPIPNWALAVSQFHIHFKNRMNTKLN